jgi:Na+-translocating ferredoxin:NAD+ oxidoreductase RNF subunit RnfB
MGCIWLVCVRYASAIVHGDEQKELCLDGIDTWANREITLISGGSRNSPLQNLLT